MALSDKFGDLFRIVVAPEFEDLDDVELKLFSDEAEIEISEKKWGTRYERGVAYLTAHLKAMADRSASGNSSSSGQLKKIKVGKLEREFSVGSDNGGGSYDLTTYGKEFLRLRRQVLIGPVLLDNRC